MYIISFSDLNFHGRILKCTWLRWTRFYIWTQSAIFIPISNFFVNLFSKLPNEMRHLFASRYSLMASFDIEKCTVPRPLLQPLWCMLVDSTILERIIYYLPYTQHLQKKKFFFDCNNYCTQMNLLWLYCHPINLLSTYHTFWNLLLLIILFSINGVVRRWTQPLCHCVLLNPQWA